MNSVITRRQVVVLILAMLMIAIAVFTGTSLNTSTVGGAQENQKTPFVAQKQDLDRCCQS